MVRLEHLISHRFRGFSDYENTLDGLISALDFGVLNLEFDIRIARCGTPMIYHDEYAFDGSGHRHLLTHIMAADYPKIGGTFARMPTADILFATVACHSNTEARLLIDIKDTGFEAEIHALVSLYRLQDRVVYVSWVPECLYRLHDMAPEIPLCLSHWCKAPDASIHGRHKIFTAVKGHIPKMPADYLTGHRSGWFVDGPLRGHMLDILRTSKGAICVPQDMVSAALVEDYHQHDITVAAFSYTDWGAIYSHKNDMNIDMYFIDKKEVFESL